MVNLISSKRIAILSNMNNNHFALARYLRDSGLDVTLLLFNQELEHFHPSCDTFDTDYMQWTDRLTWGSGNSFGKISKKEILNSLSGFDRLIGTGLAPAFLEFAGVALDIFDPYGHDIWSDVSYFRRAPPHKIAHYLSIARHQRAGIRNSKVIHFVDTNKKYEAQIRKLSGDCERWRFGMPMVYAPAFDRYSTEELCCMTHWGKAFATIRTNSDFMLVAHGRHIWGNETNINSKGNKTLLDGWAIFCKQYPSIRKSLVLLEYGLDVPQSKQYIRKLGLCDSVVWLPRMYRKDIMPGLRMADMVAAEFVHSWITGGVQYEALVAGKPLLTFRANDYFEEDSQPLYPIYNACDPQSVAERISEYISSPQTGREVGQEGRRWYDREVVDTSVQKYKEYCIGEIDPSEVQAT